MHHELITMGPDTMVGLRLTNLHRGAGVPPPVCVFDCRARMWFVQSGLCGGALVLCTEYESALEENHTLIEHYNRYKKKYREQKGDEWEAVSRTSQLRYNSNEKTTIVDGKTSNIKETIEQIESQTQFYQDTIKTVDAALFGIKTRLDIEKMLGV